MNPVSLYQLGLTFFGLTLDTITQSRVAIFTQIHEICFHGKGGYQWEEVYNMPIWLRRFTFNKIQNFYKEEQDQINSHSKKGEKTLVDSSGKINTPEFLKANKDNKRPSSYK